MVAVMVVVVVVAAPLMAIVFACAPKYACVFPFPRVLVWSLVSSYKQVLFGDH